MNITKSPNNSSMIVDIFDADKNSSDLDAFIDLAITKYMDIYEIHHQHRFNLEDRISFLIDNTIWNDIDFQKSITYILLHLA